MQTTDVEKMTISVKAAIGMLIVACGGVAGVVANQINVSWKVDAMQEQIREIKQDVKALSKVSELQGRIEQLQVHGSDAVQKLAVQLSGFQQSIDAYRMNGSPGEIKRMESMESRISDIESRLRVHEALDDKRMGKP